MTRRIGDFLVEIGVMDEDQVADVLRAQKESAEPRLFGEIAIELRYIDDEALRKYVEASADGGVKA
jgi:hypothetical protein